MFDRNLLKLEGMRGVLGALVVFALLQAGLIAGFAFGLTAAVVALWQGQGIGASVPGLVQFAACFGLLQLVRFAQDTMLDRTSLQTALRLRDGLLERAFDSRVMLARREGAAHVAAVAGDRIDEVQTYLRIIPPKLVGMVGVSAPLLACEFAIDWPSGVILAVMFPVIIFFMVLIGRMARDRADRQYASYTRLTNRFIDTLRGLSVIRAFGALDLEAAAVHGQSERLRGATMRTLRAATLSSAVLDLFATFGVAAVAIMLALRLLDGSLALSTGLVALILAPEYFAPVRAFAGDYHASLDGKNALSEVLSLLGEGQGEEAPAADGAAEGAGAEAPAADDRGAPWGPASTLELRDVSFAYDETGAGLAPVSLKVAGFANVGVVGPSGVGKSTLANLVAGFAAPTGGQVLVDGRPADLTGALWRRQVRSIPQDPYVFRASLADNVRFYRPEASREEAERAVRAVGLADLLDQLPDGMDTVIGEGARGLSGGQAHRIALARVLLDPDARILVFDEPTAHLDIETEYELKQPMRALMEGRLVFFATHRLHWLDDMDTVVTLEPSCQGEGGDPIGPQPYSAKGEVPR